MPPHPSTRRYSTERLLDLGRELHAELGDSFTLGRFSRDTNVSGSTIRDRFGSWGEFCDRLNVAPHSPGDASLPRAAPGRPRYTDEWLLARVREAHKVYGDYMTLSDFCRFAGVSTHTATRRFRDFADLRNRAGLPARGNRNWKVSRHTREGLIDQLRDIAAQVGSSLKLHDFLQRAGVSSSTFYRHFTSWSQARDYADLTPHARRPQLKTDEFLLDDLDRVATSLGRAPTRDEYRSLGNADPNTLRKRFGPTWDDVLDRGRRWCEYRRAFPHGPPPRSAAEY